MCSTDPDVLPDIQLTATVCTQSKIFYTAGYGYITWMVYDRLMDTFSCHSEWVQGLTPVRIFE